MTLQACIEELLVGGLDDWIQAAEVASVSLTTGGARSYDARRELSVRIIRKLLEEGLAEPGSVYEQEGFLPWGVPVNAAMHRIESDWATKPAGPGLGEVCWLNLTPKGHAQALRLWSRKAGRES
jgi:hypothetical protein